ncbi:Hpt domain-containing protein [Sulfurimonas sp.]|uniref:Hpt domain-containing protein n=1 Tax=Sulfurimonas sp. TaxID=2022749 RepID=UPI0035626AE0
MSILTPDYSTLNHEDMAENISINIKYIPILINSFIKESAIIMQTLETAVKDRNFSEIKSNAHAMKGSAGNLRFNEIYEMSKEMEFAATDLKEEFEYEAYMEALNNAIATIKAV